jgi:predicted nucleotidyltransferase
MSSTVENLTKRGLCRPPNAVVSNTMYETIVGSVAYGVADEFSDYDVTGFFVPPVADLFPHLSGHILGYDKDVRAPKAWQQHHIMDEDKGREYDLNIYSITVYFRLCMENNPNMVTTLYTPRMCVLHSTNLSEMVRSKRDLFLHKKCWPKYKGYAYQQLHKMKTKCPEDGSKRDLLRKKYGYDVKFAYHLVRLLLEAETIMTEGTMNITRHAEHLKAIRRGEVTQQEVFDWAASKEKHLEKVYEESTLREFPAREEIKQLLLDCLEHHYGSLSQLETVRSATSGDQMLLREIKKICEQC